MEYFLKKKLKNLLQIFEKKAVKIRISLGKFVFLYVC